MYGKCCLGLLSAFLVVGCSFGGGGSSIPAEDERQIDYEPITTFKGGVLTIDATQRDGQRVLLNTLLDADSTTVYPPEIPGHVGRAWTLLQAGQKDTVMAYAVASWDPEDPADYLSAGWWIHFAKQRYPDIDPYHDDSIAYIFIDGPELDPTRQPALPTMGAATYTGGAGGRFLYMYGDDWGDAKDKISSEEFAGVMTLKADFAAGTIEGCLGCAGDITIQRLHLQSAFDRFEAERVELVADPKDYEVHFAPTGFNPDGTFETGEGISVTHPERTITGIRRGFWGGGLSNRRDREGFPRIAVGFNRTLFDEADGSAGYFLSIFNALSEDFRKENP